MISCWDSMSMCAPTALLSETQGIKTYNLKRDLSSSPQIKYNCAVRLSISEFLLSYSHISPNFMFFAVITARDISDLILDLSWSLKVKSDNTAALVQDFLLVLKRTICPMAPHILTWTSHIISVATVWWLRECSSIGTMCTLYILLAFWLLLLPTMFEIWRQLNFTFRVTCSKVI